jgi:branched-chain amino acid transport system substrate-binding protein
MLKIAASLGGAVAIVAIFALPASSQVAEQQPVKIGVMTDMNGPFSGYMGPGAVLGAQMAVEDFGGQLLGRPIEVLTADYQNKPDVGSAIARRWYEHDGVDLIVGAENSAVALAVMKLAKSTDRLLMVTGGAAMSITNEECNDRTINWAIDNYSLTHGTVENLVKAGSKKWFFLTVDYVYGHSLQDVASKIIQENGGSVVGSVAHPLNTLDFASFLLTAGSSGAQVIGLANSGKDTGNAIKQAAEFGITSKQQLAALVLFISDVNSLGLEVAKNIVFTEAFYWDRDEETRAWSRRFFDRFKAMPTSVQAANYSSVTHYLKTVKAIGTKNTAQVMEAMKKTPVNDFFAKEGIIRNDGRMIHDMYLVQVKTPQESRYPWDYYKILSVIPRDLAFQPLSLSTCPLITKR